MADQRSDRDARGKFLPGNTASRTHALHVAQPDADFVQAARDVYARQLTDDATTDADVPARRAALMRRSAALEVHAARVERYLASVSMLDRNGGLSRRWSIAADKYLTIVSALHKVNTTLGLERRQRDVIESPDEWLRRIAQEPAGEPHASADDHQHGAGDRASEGHTRATENPL